MDSLEQFSQKDLFPKKLSPQDWHRVPASRTSWAGDKGEVNIPSFMGTLFCGFIPAFLSFQKPFMLIDFAHKEHQLVAITNKAVIPVKTGIQKILKDQIPWAPPRIGSGGRINSINVFVMG